MIDKSILLGRVLLDNFHHLLLDLLLFQSKSILVPNEIWLLWIDVILGHAAFKQTDDVSIVWILGEWQASAIMHEFLELIWLIFAKLFDLNLLLLFLNVGILFSLWSSWKALPWERALQKIEENMTDGFEIISSGLLVTNMSVDTCVSGCTSQVFAISERNMLSIRGLVAFG